MSKATIHPPLGFSNIYHRPYAQHPAPMTISLRFDIIEPWEHCHISLMMDFC